MAAGAEIPKWAGPSRRRVPRFPIEAPLEVTVLRSGIPDSLPGRAVNVGERGIAAVVAGELVPGETVGLEVQLSPAIEPLRTRAMVRYQDKLRCGLEFVAMSAQLRAAIRDWTKGVTAEPEISVVPAPAPDRRDMNERVAVKENVAAPPESRVPRRRRRGLWWLGALLLIAMGAGVFWWKWNQAWEELESGLKHSEASADKARVQVPAEVMQKLLIHRVEPVYPPEARKDKLEGIIALDVVVAKDGSVVSMKPLNGPEVLASAAMDALRWWKFEPYRVNGQPAVVETTVAMEFKK
jgi:TonB family protein